MPSFSEIPFVFRQVMTDIGFNFSMSFYSNVPFLHHLIQF